MATELSFRALRKAGRDLLDAAKSTRIKKKKYEAEIDYWRSELNNLRSWFIESSKDWWGLLPPRSEQKLNDSVIWQTNAVLTMHRLRPTYHEELKLGGDFFSGKRVLEVGCGPLVPLLQFTNCIRHGIDPLANLYIEAGWPLYDYDAKIINGFAEKMPYPDAYFDAVISVNALDHVDDFPRVANEIQRVVKPGGGIYFEVECHEPTVTEPLRLNDSIVGSAFGKSDMHKVCERGKKEMFSDLVARFHLIEDRFTDFGNNERFALWHGTRS
jgi:ubiquinone/menaquinone biosynthesis C-methylase UbiE